MYQIGSLIMYGSTGVCKVRDITTMDWHDEEKEYYVLEPVYQNGVIYAPCDNEKVAIRPVISEEEANKCIDEIPNMHTEIFPSNSMQQLTKHYQSMIDRHTVIDLLLMKKSIYMKKKAALEANKSLGQIDKKFMKRAEELLYGELAIALDIPVGEVEGYIKKRLEQ